MNASPRSCSESPKHALALLILTAAIVAALVGGPAVSAQSADRTLQIDWSMPARYGSDANRDGLIDSFPPDGPLEIEPDDGFHVNLAATGGPCSSGDPVSWRIDGRAVGASDRNVVSGDPLGCTFTYRFEEEGTFEVSVRGTDSSGAVVEGFRRVRVRDFLIVSIGDSVASGEGNPDVPFVPRWQNRQCHRSALAGPARAARIIEDMDERSSVTFVHLACSGATTLVGLLGPYEGQEPGALLPPQVTELERLAGDREIDAVLVSIGANDVHFSKVVESCLLKTDCHLDAPGSAARRFAREVRGLPSNYERLAHALELRNIPADRVYLTEYFDPTRDDTGAFCDKTILSDHPAVRAARRLGVGITAAEAQWASETMMPQLNQAGAAAAALYGWNRVGGIRDPFLTHGYCASDHWVVRYSESMPAQGNKDGSLHPNGPGHAVYGERIAAALAENLFDEEPLEILSISPLPRAQVDEEYAFTFQANRPASEVTWAVTGGELPDGLELDASGELAGTPEETGDFDFVVEARHAQTEQATEKSFELQVGEGADDAVLGETYGEPAVDVRPDGSTAAILTPAVVEDDFGNRLPQTWRLVKAGPDGEVDFTAELPTCRDDFLCYGAGFKSAVRVMPDDGAVVALMLDGRAVIARYGPTGTKLWERSLSQFDGPWIRAPLLAVAPDGRIAVAGYEFFGDSHHRVVCPELELDAPFAGTEYVELDAAGETIRERRFETTATCEAVAAGLGATQTHVTGLAVAADGHFVAVGYRNRLGQGDYPGPPLAPPVHFRSNLDTIQVLSVPVGKRLAGLAASGDGLYVVVGTILSSGWTSPVTLGGLDGTTVTTLAAPLDCLFGLTGVTGAPGSLLETCGTTIARLSDAGALVASRTFPDPLERTLLGAIVGAGGQVYTVERRVVAEEGLFRYEIARRVLNPDLSDPD